MRHRRTPDGRDDAASPPKNPDSVAMSRSRSAIARILERLEPDHDGAVDPSPPTRPPVCGGNSAFDRTTTCRVSGFSSCDAAKNRWA
jgi:hypothetical protein